MKHFFPRIQVDIYVLRSDAHQSQIIGGDADVDHTQTIGGMQSNYWGNTSPPSPWVLAPLHPGQKDASQCCRPAWLKNLYELLYKLT